MSGSLHLAPLDISVMALFGLAILGLGFSTRLKDHSVFQFLTAGRNLSLPAFVATLVCTWYGGVLGMGEAVQDYGLGTWLLLGVPYYVFAIVYAVGYAERVRDAEQISIPERLEKCFGRRVGLIGAVLIFLLAVPAAHVLMLGIVVQLASGWPLLPSVLVGALIGTLFLYKGGLLADVRVGFLAFVMMFVGFAVIAFYCLTHFDPAKVLAGIADPKLHQIDGGQGWIAVLSFLILGAWTLVDPGFHQRAASAESARVSRLGVLVSVGFWMVFDVLSITTGMYAVGLMKSPPAEPLQIFPVFADRVLPPGLKGIFLCGLLGTILSAFVGYTLVGGASFGREIVGRLRPGLDDRRIKQWTRVGLFVACGSAVVIGLSVDSVVDLWYSWAGLLLGALLIPVSVAYGVFGKWNASPRWIGASMIASFAGSFAWLIYGKRTGNEFLNVVVNGNEFSLGTLAPALAISAVVFGIGEAAGRIKRK